MIGATTAVLPLWQPWATLVAIGAKRVETRHWRCPARLIGERIGIHATKTPDHLGVCSDEPFNEYPLHPNSLPLGALIATVIVDRCSEITERSARALEERNPHEFAFGNYEPGRFAWVLRDVLPLAEPVPWTGSQGIFTVPSEMLGFEPVQTVLL